MTPADPVAATARVAVRQPRAWRRLLCGAAIALTLVLMIRADLRHLGWAEELSAQGSAPPARDAASPTGYVLGQRNILATHERGETYRWIATAQEVIASRRLPAAAYAADNAPTGRVRLTPSVYALWVAAIAQGVHLVSGEPPALCVERASLWEPVVAHALLFLAAIAFMARRHGAWAAAFTALVVAANPLLSAQFLPGVLTARSAALFLAAYALAALLPGRRDAAGPRPGKSSAVAAGLALWLDPAIGFPAVLITAVAGAAAWPAAVGRRGGLRWSAVGAGVVAIAWVLDRAPWSPAVGELRYVHPYYALAWLGLGLALDATRTLRSGEQRGWRRGAELIASLALAAPLVVTQLAHGYRGWLFPSGPLRRLSSLDESTVQATALDWLAQASPVEIALLAAPVLFVLTGLGLARWRRPNASGPSRTPVSGVALLFGALCLIGFCRVRWGVVLVLVALPVAWQLAESLSARWRRSLLGAGVLYVVALLLWSTSLPPSLRQPVRGAVLAAADVEALIHRHFSHWLASHQPGQPVSALAPPDLSDSLVFHGGCRVLLSTAWESHPGQVAAARILSAPESSEAEAVLQSREVTHVILPSWDNVLPLLVHEPADAGRGTMYARLQRWVLPRYLRAMPYRLPPAPGYAAEKLAVFKVTSPQDEALSLSRLAEYFVEMDRPEPAGLAAKVLAETFPDDPNAVLARAGVAARAGQRAAFERSLAELAAEVASGRAPFAWDRRVQRAIVLALGGRTELARREVAACVESATAADLSELTPLQAHRLQTLAAHSGATFPDPALPALLAALGAEYAAPAARRAGP